MDFMDRAPPPVLDAHPDLVVNTSNPVLQRNRSERNRLQGLMRIPTITNPNRAAAQPRTLKERWDLWMINEGGRRLFFFTWIFLHLLVFIFGWFHYQLKDNNVTARALFGETFGAYTRCAMAWLNFL
jgi:NADPH oxidase